MNRVVFSVTTFMHRLRSHCRLLCGLAGFFPFGRAAAPDYASEIKPILTRHCVSCHGDAREEGNLRLDTAHALFSGGISGSAIAPGRSAASLLMEVIGGRHADIPRMPYKKDPLPPAQIAALAAWIDAGAPGVPENETPGRYVHWSFVAPVPQQPPAISPGKANWALNPIDQFVIARLESEHLAPSPEADRATLLRRLNLDLVGLPPSPAELDAFIADRDGAYYERAVDRLLASPHYGERWGRWWLDGARYADSNGYSIDAPRQIWKYRDWVVNALNSDMPFDTFTIEQLAGDLLPGATEAQRIATGFHRNTQINQEGGIDEEQFRIEAVFDRVATTGSVWLGLTLGCAQCHDHKFDPISQREYYRLFAFFNNQDEPVLKVFTAGVNPAGLAAEKKDLEARLIAALDHHAAEIAAWEAALTPALRSPLTAEVRRALAVSPAKRNFNHRRLVFAAGVGDTEAYRVLNERYGEIDELLTKGVTTLVLAERATPRKSQVFTRGDFTRPSDEVTPGTPVVLHPFENATGRASRLDLARWITEPRNPLTTRVTVNRVWQHYFGRGLVETENDFGLQGAAPSHPELLDWLALEFTARGWSLKTLHRLIVTSRTYRQSSADRPDLRERDPHNILLARQRRLRLDAEIVRDVSLAASGLLAPRIGGPPVFPLIPDGVMGQGQLRRTWKVSPGEDRYRRALYTHTYRGTPPPALNVFDAPDGTFACTRRGRSNTPLQALTLMNDPAHVEFATALEKIVRRDGLAVAFRRCTSRTPTDDELSVLGRVDPLTAARTLLNLDETITRD